MSSSEESAAFTPKFSGDGLISAIATDAANGMVLMVAYMNDEALRLSIETGEAHYFSRSRGKIWRKGETSGNTQKIIEMRTDCDQDTIWIAVEQKGGAACHTGRKTCFYRVVGADGKTLSFSNDEKIFDPHIVYKK
ncbi:MAG: phosphoribosyl-AMP cyclohydrolase [Hyphomicrobiales bacterium]